MRLILPMPGNEHFGESVAHAGGWENHQLEWKRFPDGESYVRLTSDVKGRYPYAEGRLVLGAEWVEDSTYGCP